MQSLALRVVLARAKWEIWVGFASAGLFWEMVSLELALSRNSPAQRLLNVQVSAADNAAICIRWPRVAHSRRSMLGYSHSHGQIITNASSDQSRSGDHSPLPRGDI